jgi:hypothetical protein
MAAERSDLLAQLAGLGEAALSQQPLKDRWTAKDLLVHVASWDGFFAGSVEMALMGRAGQVADVSMDERNAAIHVRLH